MTYLFVTFLLVSLILLLFSFKMWHSHKMMNAQIKDLEKAIDKTIEGQELTDERMDRRHYMRELQDQISQLRREVYNDNTINARQQQLIDLQQRMAPMGMPYSIRLQVPEELRERALRMGDSPMSSMSSSVNSMEAASEMTSSWIREQQQEERRAAEIKEEKRKEEMIPRKKRSRYETLEI